MGSSVVYQVKTVLQEIFTVGVSRAKLKRQGVADRSIVSIATMEDYLNDCCQFARWCQQTHGVRFLREITPEMAEAYVRGMVNAGLSGGYIGRVKSAIRKLDEGMRAKKWCKRKAPELLPAGGGWHSDSYPERAYTPTQAERIITFMREHTVEKQVPDVVQMQWVAGLRISEAVMIRAQDIDISDPDGSCVLSVTKATKGGRPREVVVGTEHRPFLERLVELGKTQPNGHVFQGRGKRGVSLAHRVQMAVHYACEQLKIDCYGTHGFRKCWAQQRHRELEAQGWDDWEARSRVAEGLGHNRMTVTYSYIPRE